MSPTRDAFSVTRNDEVEPPPRTGLSSETRLTGPASFATDEDIESIFASLSYLLDGNGANDSTALDAPAGKASAPPPARSTPAPAQEVIHVDDSWLEEGPAAVTMRMPADYPARITVRPARLDVPAAARPSRPGFLSRQREVVTPLIATLTAAASAAMPSTATAAPQVSSPCAIIRDSAPPSRPSAKLLLPPRKLVPRPRALPPKPQPPPMKAFALPSRPPPLPTRLPLLPLPPMPPAQAPAPPPAVDTSVMPMNASSASWPLVAPPVPQPPPARQPGARASRIFGLTAIAGAVLTAGVCLAMLLHVRSLQAPGRALAPAPSPNAVSAVLAPPPAAPAPAPTLPRVAELPPPAAPAALAAPAAPVAPAAPAAPTAPAPTATTPPASPRVRTMPRSLPSEPFVPAPWVAERPRMVAVPPPPAAPPLSSPAPLPPAAPAQKPASAAIPSTGPVLFDDR